MNEKQSPLGKGGQHENDKETNQNNDSLLHNDIGVKKYNGWFPLPRILPSFEEKAFGLVNGKIIIEAKITDGELGTITVEGHGHYA